MTMLDNELGNYDSITKAVLDIEYELELNGLMFYGVVWDIMEESGIHTKKEAKKVLDICEITDNKLRHFIYDILKERS